MGTALVQVYWITGRSPSSRNRLLARTESGVETRFRTPEAGGDPALLLYPVMLEASGWHVVSNGTHTRDVLQSLQAGMSFPEALEGLRHEPDAPHYTPRICAAVAPSKAPARAYFGRVLAHPSDPSQSVRTSHSVPLTVAGLGFALHTYANDGEPLPSFREDPFPVPVDESPRDAAERYFDALPPDRRVAVVARVIDLTGGTSEYAVVNA